MRTIALMILMFSVAAEAQTPVADGLFIRSRTESQDDPQPVQLTGVLSQDLFAVQPSSDDQDSTAVLETRSALKAGAFSLLIPGTGQLYNHNYVKAAAFFAVEVAGWVVDAMWIQKGNNQTTYFQNYADGSADYKLPGGQADPYGNGHYSVLRYAQWIQANWQQLLINGGHNPSDNTDPNVQTVLKYEPTMVINNGQPAPWSQVDWYSLNQVEGSLGGYFTHFLPPHGNQQYYELIGKYPQFRQGWDDSPYAKGNASYVDFMDYSTTNSGYYMDQRGKANSLYAVASTAVAVVLVNHFASAIEAAIWAHNHNKRIQANVAMSKLPIGFGYQTELKVAVSF